MAQLTDLNVSPYYDDFNKNDNFQKVLFRPGFAVQARELTTLQSILADQIESQGKFIFKEGAEVQYMLQSFGRNDMKDTDDFTIVKPQPDPQYYYSDSSPVYNEVSLMLPIHQRNTYFNMKIYSDSPFPVTLNKLMWEGSYNLRYYRRV